jgi:hypothetical protein
MSDADKAVRPALVTKLQKVGFLDELPPQERKQHLQSSRRELPEAEEARVLRYLRAGRLLAVVPGMEEDVLADPPVAIGPPNIHTDGVWAWPETFVHYIGRYHIPVPDAFLHHMRAVSFECPTDIDLGGLILGDDVPIK